MKICIITLGCPKNVVDSETLRPWFAGDKIGFTNQPELAEVIIINTCAFILPAREEAIEVILEAVDLKKQGKAKYIYVVGCLPQRYTGELKKEIPEVDGFFPQKDFNIVGKQIAANLKLSVETKTKLRKLETPDHYAYLKLSEGCDNRCKYCTIPDIKGRHQSRDFNFLIKEANELVDGGVRELILVAQDITYFGRDLGDRSALHKLIKSLAKIDQLKWIRLLYAHPAHVDDALIQLMKEEEKVCRYIDMPIQHISDKILKSMGRNVKKAGIEKTIEKFRKQIPGIAMRTTLMVGYPGEGDKEFEELKEFVKNVEFERLGVFKFIPEDGTKAANMTGQVPEEIKEDRLQEIMDIQEEIAGIRNRELLGKTVTVLVDEKNERENTWLSRSEWDTPLIDNSVHLQGNFETGKFYKVKITRADAFDLWAKI